MSTSIVSPLSSSSSSSPATAPASTARASATNDPLANEATFLKLLVSQLQNQNPLNPVDGTQFVSQLTSYSQLEQLIGIHQNTTALANTPPAGTQPASGTGATSLKENT